MDNPFFKRFREFVLAPSHSRTISAVVILIIAAAIPLTVLIAQQQQEVRQQAATCTPGQQTCGGSLPRGYQQCNSSGTGYDQYQCPVGYHCGGTPGKPGDVSCYIDTTPIPTSTAIPTANPSMGPTASPLPTTVPVGSINLAVTPYCGIPNVTNNGIPPGIINPPPGSTNNANVSSFFMSWTRPSASDYMVLNYTGSDTYLVGTSNSFYGPRAAGTTFPRPDGTNITYTQCSSGTQSGTGFACGAVSGSTVNWTMKQCTGSNCSAIKATFNGSFTAATCPTATTQCTNGAKRCSSTGIPQICTNGAWADGTACTGGQTCNTSTGVCEGGTPSCGALTANPSSVSVNGNSNLSIACTNTTSNTTYTWTSNTCGTVTQNNSSSTSWTAPATGPTSCPVGVNVCNGTSCTPGNTTITVTIPDCNAGSQPTSACVATTANTCSANNGTQTAKYTTYNGSTVCNPVNTTQTCTVQSCNVGNVCQNGNCVGQATPTPTPASCTDGAKQCSVTGIPQTCTNGAWVDGTACPSGQTCTNGTCTSTAGRTILAFTIGMDAIGSAGDNVNPNPSSSNQNPVNPTRNLAVQIFDSNNNQVFAKVGSINYNSGSGVFTGTVDLGTNFANGNYLVLVKSDGHLRRRIPGIQNLTSALPQPIQLQRVNLVAGDVKENNALNIEDYNILLSCVTDPDVTNIDNKALCNTNPNYVKLSDLEDNGVVNKFDYNLFLREYAVQSGD